jgi:hypothetical protein
MVENVAKQRCDAAHLWMHTEQQANARAAATRRGGRRMRVAGGWERREKPDPVALKEVEEWRREKEEAASMEQQQQRATRGPGAGAGPKGEREAGGGGRGSMASGSGVVGDGEGGEGGAVEGSQTTSRSQRRRKYARAEERRPK